MTDEVIGGAIIEMGVETSGVDAGLDRIDAGVQRTGRTIATLGTQGSAALERIGTASASSASRLDNITRNLANSGERAIAALEAGKKSGADYLESLGQLRGADMDVLGPLIARFRELEQVQAAAAQSAIETARAEAQAQREVAQALASRESFLTGLREQVALTQEQTALYGRSADEALRYRAALAGVAAEAEPLIAELREQRAAHEQLEAAARAEAQAQRDAARVQTNRDSFIASLEQQASALGRTRSELLQLQAAQLGVSDQAAPFIARLRDAEAGLDRTGTSAAQTANALRGVPAQFTDIVTSLQGGQPAITVFLQQGGQLRDMFGGLGPAARALGGYVVSLINPLTLAAGAAGALALAYYQGSKEGDAFARSIVLTGNAAGTTTGQLTEMARAVSKAAGTQSDAAAVLASLVGSGKVGADNLQRFATVAVKAQRDIGLAAAETAKDFAELAKSPLQATERLNEKFGYLTGAIYAQIKALEEQGRTEAAAEVAQKAYADALDGRSDKMKARLGSIEKAWAGITGTAKKAWDAMLNVGREETPEQEIDKLVARIAKARKPLPAVNQKDIGSVLLAQQQERYSGRLEAGSTLTADESRLKLLQSQVEEKKKAATLDAERQKTNEAEVEWQKIIGRFLPRQVQLENELAAIRNKGKEAHASESEILKAQGELRKEYADIYNDAIDAQIAKLQQRAAIEEEMDKRARLSLASARSTGLSSSFDLDIQYALDIEKLDQAQLARQKEKLQAELAFTKQKQNSKKDQAALQNQIDVVEEKSLTRKAELQKQIADIDTKSTREAANNLQKLADKRQDELVALQAQLEAQQEQNSLIGASREQINSFNLAKVEERARRLENQAAIIGENAARADEAGAMMKAAEAMRELAKSQADGLLKTEQFEQQKRLWESIDQTAHDTFVNIFNDGKSAFDRLRDTLKSGLLDLLYQMTIKKWIFNVGAEVSGSAAIASLGGGSVSGASGSSAGSLGNIANLYSAGKNAYGLVTGGLGVGIGGGITSLGNLVGSQSLQGFGMGFGGWGSMAQAYAPASSVSAGAATAAYAVPALYALGGIFGGRAISGGYSAFGGSGNSAVNIGTAIGTAILPGIGSLVGGLVGGLVNRAFGRGNKEVTSQGVRGTLTSAGFSGETFADWHQDGGWFRSDRNGTDKSPVDVATSKAFVDTYAQLKAVTGDFAKTLGVDIAALTSRSQELNITLTSDAEANKTAITNFFTGVADTMAKELVPSLVSFASEGESTSATLQRLASNYQAVDLILMTIGRASENAFGAIGIASLAAREQLIAAAGGLDLLASGTTFFAQNFLSPAEQMAPIIANVKKQLAELGAAGTSTNDQFKALVMGLDLSTAAGAKQYVELLKIAPQFKQMTDYLASLDVVMQESSQAINERADLQRQYDQATLTKEQLLAQERAALDPSNRALFDKVQAAKAVQDLAAVNAGYQKQIDDFLKSTLSASQLRALETKDMAASTLALYDRLDALKAEAAAKDAAEKARQSAVATLQSFGDALLATMKNAEAAAKSLTDFSQSLLLGDLSPLDPEQRYQAAKKQLLSSDPGDTAAATAFLNAAKERDAGDYSYSRDFALVQSRISAAAAAQYSLAAGVPSTWEAIQKMYREQMAPISSNPGQLLAAAAPTPVMDTTALEGALTKMADKVVLALAPIATSTEKAATVLDQVTEGGSAMLVNS